mmetsp:Transcript_1070/g.2317  ORF Transcript_1070/g.2317 Transcript_1070/m.2317 type:complete len:103 (-) Transcript_1070:1200-1508(-)
MCCRAFGSPSSSEGHALNGDSVLWPCLYIGSHHVALDGQQDERALAAARRVLVPRHAAQLSRRHTFYRSFLTRTHAASSAQGTVCAVWARRGRGAPERERGQ